MLATVRDELLGRLDHFALAPLRILDVHNSVAGDDDALSRRFPKARILATRTPNIDTVTDRHAPDSAIASLSKIFRLGEWKNPFARRARLEFVDAPLEHLPLAAASIDLVLANLWQPGTQSLDASLMELNRVLAPGGLFLWSTLGPGTGAGTGSGARDLRTDQLDLLDMHDLGGALARAGFVEPVLDVDRYLHRSGTLSLGSVTLEPQSAIEVIHVAAFAAQPPHAALKETRISPGAIGRRSKISPASGEPS